MPTPSLPSYCKILAANYSEAPEPTVIRTDMESGPPKQVRYQSRGMVRRTVLLAIDANADYQAFVAWVRDTLQGGALWFTYTDPVTAATLTARLINGQYRATPGAGVKNWVVETTFESWGA